MTTREGTLAGVREKTTEVFDNYYKSEEYYDYEDNSNVTIIEIDN